jgi:hypothetical protein
MGASNTVQQRCLESVSKFRNAGNRLISNCPGSGTGGTETYNQCSCLCAAAAATLLAPTSHEWWQIKTGPHVEGANAHWPSDFMR